MAIFNSYVKLPEGSGFSASFFLNLQEAIIILFPKKSAFFVQLADNLGIIINNHAITWGYPIKSASSLPRGHGLRQLVLHNLSAEDPPKSVQTNSEMDVDLVDMEFCQFRVSFFFFHPPKSAGARQKREVFTLCQGGKRLGDRNWILWRFCGTLWLI